MELSHTSFFISDRSIVVTGLLAWTVQPTSSTTCAVLCSAAGRAMLASLAAAPLLVKPAFAQEGDAVDSAVDSLTSIIKVTITWYQLQPQPQCHQKQHAVAFCHAASPPH